MMRSKLSDIGTAQNQPVGAEAITLTRRTHEEQVACLLDAMARLRVENARLRAELRVLRNYDPPTPLPRHQEPKNPQPVPVHPPCSVTHRGGV